MMQATIPINKYHGYALGAFIFLIALALYTTFQNMSIFVDCDSPWHIAAGEHMRNTGRIPRTDPFSFTSGDTVWYNMTWLFDVIVSWIHDVAGLRGLVAINLLLAALIPALLVKLCLVRGSAFLPTLVACSISLILLLSGVVVRGQQTAVIFIIVSLILLAQYRKTQTNWVWGLVPIAMLWANIHGSFLVIFTIIGSFGLEAIFTKDIARIKTYLLVGIACLLAVMVNPYGYEIYYASWLSLGSEFGQANITEWQAASFSNMPQTLVYVGFLILLLFKVRPKLPLAEILLFTFWMLMALNAIRHGILFFIFAAPVLALTLTKLMADWGGKVQSLEDSMRRDFAQRNRSLVMLSIVGLIGVIYIVPMTRNLIISDNLYDPMKYPVNEIAYLNQNYTDKNVINLYCYGGYINYQTKGNIRPMIDSRIDTVYPDDVIWDYGYIHDFRPSWERVTTRYDANLALFPNDFGDGDRAFSNAGWKIIHKGEVATIYQRPNSGDMP